MSTVETLGQFSAPPLLDLGPKGWGVVFSLFLALCYMIGRSIIANCLRNQKESFSDYKYTPLTNQLLLPGAYRGR